MAYINLQSSKEHPSPDLANTSQFVVHKVVRRIRSDKTEYVILEYSEDEISNPNSDPLILGVLKRNGEGRLYKQYALWNNKVWDIVEPSTIRMLAAIAGINIPEENESARIRELNEQVERMNAMHSKGHVN